MATAWLSLFVSAGSSGFIYSIFIPDMMADLDWPRSVLVAAASLSTVAGSFAGPVIGRFIDLRGARLVMAVSLLAISGSTLLLWGIQEPWQLFLLYGIIGGAARMTLQQVAPGAMVAQWFLRRRALAFSLTALGPPFSSLVLPPIIAVLIVSLGWRPTWAVLAIVGLAIGLPPILLLVRRRPEDMGLYPDGDAAPAAPSGSVASLIAKGRRVGEEWSFSEAVHNLGFWMLATSMALISVAPNAATIFMFPYFSDQGLSPTAAAATLSVMSLFQVISRIAFWAPVIARLGSVRYALLLWGGLLFITTALTPFSKTEATAYAISAFFGLAMGGNMVLQLQVWPEYFGRLSVGAISGTAFMVNGIITAVAPLAAAALLDATGNYFVLYGVIAACVLAGLILQLLVGQPARRAQPGAVAAR